MLLEKVKNGLELPKDAANREEVFQEIKDKTTAWVAKYRRGAAFQGRPSYRCKTELDFLMTCHLHAFQQPACRCAKNTGASILSCAAAAPHTQL